MMKNTRWVGVSVVAGTLLLGACTQRDSNKNSPTGPDRGVTASSPLNTGCTTTITQLNNLAVQVFGAGSPNVNSVLGKLDNLDKKVQQGDLVGAQAQAHNIVDFVLQKATQSPLPGQQYVDAFISGVLCFAGLSPDTFLILPSDQAQVITAANQLSGVSLQGNTVNVPTLLTINTLDPNAPSPLVTKLDQYPVYIDITFSSALTKEANVAVCPTGNIPQEVRDRLRLGHQTAAFEITPPAPHFLDCPVQVGQSAVPKWLRSLASVFVPKPLYAAVFATPGIGGLASEFSPFGAVDPVLKVSGIGGLPSEFRTRGGDIASLEGASKAKSGAPTTGAAGTSGTSTRLGRGQSGPALKVVNGVCTEGSATVGTALEPECRPVVTVTTELGTIMGNVPVAWAMTGGGGTIAPLVAGTCGASGTAAATTTDPTTGKASICWTMGPNAGANSATATLSPGGDAPAGVTFKSDAGTLTVFPFTATGLLIATTATAVGGDFTFDNQDHPGSGSCSNGANAVLTYPGGTVPKAVGSYTLTATCNEGSTVYELSTATATINIGVVTPSVSVTCPASVVYDGSAQTPCSASVTAPGLSQTPVPTYSNNTNVGTATASVSFAATGNYGAASGSANFDITPAGSATTVTCSPVSLTYTGSALAPCSATATGAGGLNASVPVTYSNNTSVGTATASATFAGDNNHSGSTGSANFDITPAGSTTTVTCSPASLTYTGSALTPCSATATGAGGLSASVPVSYGNNTNVGSATASATFAGDGNHSGSTGNGGFAITAAATIVSMSCTSTLAYDGTVKNPCTASVSGPLLSAPVSVTYNPAPPKNAGNYGATATFAAGGNYQGSSATGSFSITQIGATATGGSATMNFGAAMPALSPCTVAGLLGVDAGSVTCTNTSPTITIAGSYPVVPIVSPASPVNYGVTKVNGTLTVLGYQQVGCFSSPVYSVMPSSKSAQRKGSNLPIKCTLTTQQGVAVTTATGNISIMDAGTTAQNPPVRTGNIVLTLNNVFKYSSGGNYAYGLDTLPAVFVAGHYYYVIANWNDGSNSEGWFLLK